jgi:hypothetical protein
MCIMMVVKSGGADSQHLGSPVDALNKLLTVNNRPMLALETLVRFPFPVALTRGWRSADWWANYVYGPGPKEKPE